MEAHITKEGIALFFYNRDESEVPTAILYTNGSSTFYRLKKMNREEVSNLLGVDTSKQ